MADEKNNDLNAKPSTAEKTENAATSYGLEDHEATSWDPRVYELKNQRSMHTGPPRTTGAPATNKLPGTPKVISRSTSLYKVSENKTGEKVERTSKYNTPDNPSVEPSQIAPAPATVAAEARKLSITKLQEEASRVEAAHETPQTVTVYNPPPVQPMARQSHKEKTEGVTKYVNTDITFDPSKQYASKTTNTSGLVYENPAPVLPSAPPPSPSQPPQPPKILTPSAVPFLGYNSAPNMSKQEIDDMYDLAVALIRNAGAIALSAIRVRPAGANKPDERDPRARAVTDIEETMIEAIKEKYPEHKIISAKTLIESSFQKVTLTNEPTWVVNPMDGVVNYGHSFPYYCISIAVIMNKETTFGIVFNPSLDELYTARLGEGTQLNGIAIRASNQDKLKSGLVLQEYNSDMSENRTSGAMENAKRLIRKAHALRSIGSAAMGMAMVASGAADAFYFFGLHVWDMVAGNILITEAGGTVIDPSGGSPDIMSRRVLAAATRPLALALSVEIVQDYPTPRDDEPLVSQHGKKDFSAQTDFSDSSDELESDMSKSTTYHNAQ